MSIGTLLVEIAIVALVVAYLARPFRSPRELDQAIERWLKAARPEPVAVTPCPQCGQAVAPTDRFCRRCGHTLPGTDQ
jgi:uncharacterized OB-fold protein